MTTTVRTNSYSDWLRDEVDRGSSRTLEGTSSWGDPIHFLQRRQKIIDLLSAHAYVEQRLPVFLQQDALPTQ